jgi:MFS family permease
MSGNFFAFRALMGVFAGFSSAAIALVASQVPEGRLGCALGWLSTGQLVGSLVGPLIGGALADLTGSYRIPFYCTSANHPAVPGSRVVRCWWAFCGAPKARGRRSILSSLIAVASTPVLLALFFVLMMAQFGVRTVQPIVTLYVQELVGARPTSRPWGGIAFSVTGLANVIAAPFLGNRSDRIGYRRVLLICLCGATLTTLPQAFTENYWVFTAQRFGVGLFIGGLLPTANALVGRLVPPTSAAQSIRKRTIAWSTSSSSTMGIEPQYKLSKSFKSFSAGDLLISMLLSIDATVVITRKYNSLCLSKNIFLDSRSLVSNSKFLVNLSLSTWWKYPRIVPGRLSKQ